LTTVSRSAIALALTLVSAAQPDAAFAVGASDAGPAHHRHADPNKARALAAPEQVQPPPTERAPETDGLGRHDEDCKFGCIDH